MKISLPCVLSVLLVSSAVAAPPPEEVLADLLAEKDSSYNIQPLYNEIRQVVRRHYPKATSHSLGDKIHFEHDTRIFVIHEALKTGEWQDPFEVRGPKLNGIHCDVSIRPGRWGGAAVVPQTFNKRYFTSYLAAPYSEKLDAHLYVLIRFPRNVPDGFWPDLGRILDNFDRHVTVKDR